MGGGGCVGRNIICSDEKDNEATPICCSKGPSEFSKVNTSFLNEWMEAQWCFCKSGPKNLSGFKTKEFRFALLWEPSRQLHIES